MYVIFRCHLEVRILQINILILNMPIWVRLKWNMFPIKYPHIETLAKNTIGVIM